MKQKRKKERERVRERERARERDRQRDEKTLYIDILATIYEQTDDEIVKCF